MSSSPFLEANTRGCSPPALYPWVQRPMSIIPNHSTFCHLSKVSNWETCSRWQYILLGLHQWTGERVTFEQCAIGFVHKLSAEVSRDSRWVSPRGFPDIGLHTSCRVWVSGKNRTYEIWVTYLLRRWNTPSVTSQKQGTVWFRKDFLPTDHLMVSTSWTKIHRSVQFLLPEYNAVGILFYRLDQITNIPPTEQLF